MRVRIRLVCRIAALLLLAGCAHHPTVDQDSTEPAGADVSEAVGNESAGKPSAAWHLGRAGRLALDPALYLADVALALPQFLRPLRAVGTVVLAPFKVFFPPGFVLDLATAPADLAAPFVALYHIVTGLPRLIWSPLLALWHLGAAAAG